MTPMKRCQSLIAERTINLRDIHRMNLPYPLFLEISPIFPCVSISGRPKRWQDWFSPERSLSSWSFWGEVWEGTQGPSLHWRSKGKEVRIHSILPILPILFANNKVSSDVQFKSMSPEATCGHWKHWSNPVMFRPFEANIVYLPVQNTNTWVHASFKGNTWAQYTVYVYNVYQPFLES